MKPSPKINLVSATPRVLGIIPARGGSKGVPRKNIRPVGGKPLIYYTIRESLTAQRLSDVVISTEDSEIASIAKDFGAWVPFLRPEELAQDATPSFPVAEYTIKKLEEMGKTYDYILWLQPTTPLRQASDIDRSIELLINSDVDCVLSVDPVEDYHPCRMYRLVNGVLSVLEKDNGTGLRQYLDKIYHRNGAIYAFRKEVLMEYHNFFGKKILPYEMPRSRSVNIDDEYDLLIADFLIHRGSNP